MSRKRKQPKLSCPPAWQQLKRRCLAPLEAYFQEGEVHDTPDGPYVFTDRGAPVLAVAHLDTVIRSSHFGAYPDDEAIYCAQLDDRLGAHIALDLLPKLGVNVDVLLTDGEESCRSTAAHFTPTKDYNWMVEFDRGGADIVTYQYEGEKWLYALDGYGNLGWGSYSDIASLDHLGVCGVNWGIGYYLHHTPGSYFVPSEMLEAVKRFAAFYCDYASVRFEYDIDGSWGAACDDWSLGADYQPTSQERDWERDWEDYIHNA